MDRSKGFIPYSLPDDRSSLEKIRGWFRFMDHRRSVRKFSPQHVDRAIIEEIIRTASTAPSGAHKQPWTFCAVSDPEIKLKIRQAAEQEEFENYHGRTSEEWLKDLE